MMGLRVMVTDDRREFANTECFLMAEAISIAPYDRGVDAFQVTPNTAIVFGSRGYHFDDLVTEEARTNAGYVGLLGSKRKTIMIYEWLLRKGVQEERLREIHAPVGLDLGERAPEELALGIACRLWRGTTAAPAAR